MHATFTKTYSLSALPLSWDLRLESAKIFCSLRSQLNCLVMDTIIHALTKFTGIRPPQLIHESLDERLFSFSFSVGEHSLPVSSFIISLERQTKIGYELCEDYADNRILTKRYQLPRDDSEVFVQEFLNVEENSSYIVKITAQYNIKFKRVIMRNSSISIHINTPAAGKISKKSA